MQISMQTDSQASADRFQMAASDVEGSEEGEICLVPTSARSFSSGRQVTTISRFLCPDMFNALGGMGGGGNADATLDDSYLPEPALTARACNQSALTLAFSALSRSTHSEWEVRGSLTVWKGRCNSRRFRSGGDGF